MQVNNIQPNVNPSFQMAFKIKGFESDVSGITEEFSTYAIRGKRQLAGFKKFQKDQAKLEHYDVVFDPTTKRAEVIDEAETVISSHGNGDLDLTGFDFDKFHIPGRKLFARFFHPEKYLPYSLLAAGKEAKVLEKNYIAKEKLAAKIKTALKSSDSGKNNVDLG